MRSCQVLIVEVLCIVEISPPKYFSTIATARHLNPEPQCCFIGCKDGCGIAYLCAPGRFRGGGQNYCNLLHLTTKYFSALLQRDPPWLRACCEQYPVTISSHTSHLSWSKPGTRWRVSSMAGWSWSFPIPSKYWLSMAARRLLSSTYIFKTIYFVFWLYQ